jgi:hypothetical protein
VVAVNPGTVLGPMIQPTLNASMAMFLRLLQGIICLHMIALLILLLQSMSVLNEIFLKISCVLEFSVK